MKKIYSLITVSTLFISAQAQNFDWAKREGEAAYDYGYGITTDNNGNVYAAGKYEMNANFSGTILPCQGNHDIWLAQYSPAGDLNWIRTAGGFSGDYAWGVACDNSFLYIAGEIEGDTANIKFVGSPISLKCISSNDIFVAKYDLSGNLIWAKSAGGYNYEKALSVTYDNAGNVYVCGLYRDTITFGGTTIVTGGQASIVGGVTTIPCTTVGVEDLFVAKYDKDGNFLWVQHGGGPGRDEAKSIKCDAAGNVYICGMYTGTAAFGSVNLTSVGNFDIFLAKYSPSGALLWVKSAGDQWNDVAWSLALDNAGKIYIAGECAGYVAFDNIHIATAGGFGSDAFVACYDASGNAQWAKSAGGQLDDRARGIGIEGNNLYITGQFGSTVTIGASTLTAADSSDIFFASLDNSGNFIRATSVGGAADAYENLGYESGIAICGDAAGSGAVYATGALLDGGVFGGTTLTPYSRTDVFITKISLLTGVNDLANNNAKSISAYPNPSNGNFTLDLSQLPNQKIETTITNCMGQVINKTTDRSSSKMNINLSGEDKGIYFIEIKAEDQSISRGKIVLQ